MITVAIVLGLLAVAGVILLSFGYSALLRLVRELQDAVGANLTASARHMTEFQGMGISIVLVTDRHCLSCVARTTEFFDLARRRREGALSFTLATAGAAEPPPQLPDNVRFIADPATVGQLGVGISPSGIVFDRRGTELARSVLANQAALEKLVAWAAELSEIEAEAEPGLRGLA